MKFCSNSLAAAIVLSLIAQSVALGQTSAPEATVVPAKTQPTTQKPKRRAKPEPEREPRRQPVKNTTPRPAAAPIILPDPPIPVVQARQVGLDRCAPMLNAMSHESLTTTYDVQSGWSPILPANHVFQSVAALTHPGNIPPDGFAALVAAPLASGACDGVIMQVFPLAGDCVGAQKLLLASGGRTIGPLLNTRIMVDAAGRRLFLVPGYANTCIAVAVDSRFAPQ